MKLGQIVLIVYGLLLIAGGLIGYVKAESLSSLVAGGVSGIIAIATFAFSLRQRPVAYLIGSALALALVCAFAWRLAKTGSFMPSGAMLVLSALVLLLLLVARSSEGKASLEDR